MGSIMETHLEYVKRLEARGEIVLQPKVGKPMGSIEGYIKTQIPHKDAGAIFKDKDGTFGLFGDMGALHVTGIMWCDLGLCDSKCWYEWMSPEDYRPEFEEKYLNPSLQHFLDVRASELWSDNASVDAFIEEAAEAIQAVIHSRRERCDAKTVLGEMADLQIMLNRMKLIFGESEFDKVLASKYAALDEKLDNFERGNVVL